MHRGLRVGAVVPALDEEASVGGVVRGFLNLRGDGGGPLLDDLVVCDNGSRDRTAEVAQAAGARVVREPRRGYGSACLAGIRALAPVDVVLFANADASENPAEATALLDAVATRRGADGADLVVGTRVGRAEKGAMSVPQRLGNALAASLVRLLWGAKATDLGPFRAVRRDALEELEMSDPDFGWTVEMGVKAVARGLRVVEVPVSYLRRRAGDSKISGTIRGTISAGAKILWTIGRLRFLECPIGSRARAALVGAVGFLCVLLLLGAASTSLLPKPQVRGIALGLHAGDDGYDYDLAIEEIHATGANAVELVVPFYQDDTASNAPAPIPARTPSWNRIGATIASARRRGLRVYLLPIVLLENPGPSGWRGVLAPEDPEMWWRSYTDLIERLAVEAEQSGADGLAVGSELHWSEEDRTRWAGVIARVRGVFRGRVLYSANWDHYEPVAFWDLLDAVGISGYFELTPDPDAPQEELDRAWAGRRGEIEDFVRRTGKPLLFTEIGYPAKDGGAVHPWDYTKSSPPDEDEQAMAIEAFLRSYRDAPELRGVFFYEWDLPGHDRGDYSPRDRRAEALLRDYFAEAR